MAARDAHLVNKSIVLREDSQPDRRPGEWSGAPRIQPKNRSVSTQQAYVKHILLHPFHVALVISVALLAILTKSLWLIPLAFIAEILFGSVVACSQKCRQLVEGEMEPADLLLPAEHRAAMVAQMSDEHREELERLEMQVGNIRENCASEREMLIEQPYDLTLLLRGYVDLATAHQAHAAALSMSDRATLVDELQSLEDAVTGCTPGRLRHLVERRRDVVCRRLASWDQNKQAMQEIEHQLATIGSLIGLIHEKSIVHSEAGWVSDEVDRIAEDLERHENALLEVSA